MDIAGLLLRRRHFVSCVLLALFALLAVTVMRQKSMVTDEMVTFLPGYSYLRTGDFRLTFEHPPLSKYIAAIPLLFLNPDLPLDHPAWREANSPALGLYFLYHNRVDAGRILFFGRIGSVACACILGLFVYLWALRLFGTHSGLMALFLYCVSPTIVANAAIATVDMTVTCFISVAVFCYWRFCQSPGLRWLILSTASFACAQLSQFSALMLVPIYIIIRAVLLCAPVNDSEPLPRDGAGLRHLIVAFAPLAFIFCAGAVLVWAAYGFETAPVNSLVREMPPWLARHMPGRVGALSCPAPSYLRGLFFQMRHASGGHPAFLMGRYSQTGWWYYFPVAFLIKTPLAAILLFIIALVYFTRAHAHWRDEIFIIVPPIFIFLSCMLQRINIGVRYILPVYPFLFIYISRLMALDFTFRPLMKFSVALLCAWYLASSAWIYPHYLAYFNELIGGPRQGYRYLVDSNLDWGQDVKGLKAYMEQHRIQWIWECGFYEDVLGYYGISYSPLPEDGRGVRGYVAISAMELQCVRGKNRHAFDWLKQRTPVAQIGYSIFVYAIDTPPIPAGGDDARAN